MTWLALGAAAGALAVMDSVSALLLAVEGANSRAYGASVFTGFRLAVWDTTDLAAALTLWASDDAIDLGRLIRWHVGADLAFIAAYAYLAHRLLVAVGAADGFRRWSVAAVVVADLAETALLDLIVGLGTTWEPLLVAARTASSLKWAATAVLVVGIVVAWWRDDGDHATSRVRTATSLEAWRRHEEVPAPLALTGQIALVTVFALLIALPAGGPLEQVPDVLRYQLSGAPTATKVLSVVALGLLALSVAASGRIGTPRLPPPPSGCPSELSSRWIVPGAVAASAGLGVVAVALGQPIGAPMAAPAVVAVAVAVAGLIADRALHPEQPGAEVDVETSVESRPEVETEATDPAATAPDLGVRQDRWSAGLAGVVVVAGGVGLIRATVPFLLLGDGDWRWGAAFGLAVVTVLVGGMAAHVLLLGVAGRAGEPGRRHDDTVRWSARAVSALAIAAAVVLAVEPATARWLGSTGTFAVAFSAYLVVVGSLQFLAQRTPPWSATRRLGLGERTPWLMLLVATWIVASVLHTTTDYHRVRTDVGDVAGPAAQAAGQRYSSVEAAFAAWSAANLGTGSGVDPANDETCRVGDTVPLVLVAAPGGGVRAAHWTAGALDLLFPEPCRQRLFAVSGASGGSVGATAWLAAIRADRSPTAAVDGMRRDDAWPPPSPPCCCGTSPSP